MKNLVTSCGFLALVNVVGFLGVGQSASAQTPLILTGSARFEQVALTTSNLEQATTFYRDKVGLPLLFETNGMVFFDVGGVRLMVAADAQRKRNDRPQSVLYFQVDDFDRSVERLRQCAVPLMGEVETVQLTPSGSLKLQQFEDPDGNILAVMGIVAAS